MDGMLAVCGGLLKVSASGHSVHQEGCPDAFEHGSPYGGGQPKN